MVKVCNTLQKCIPINLNIKKVVKQYLLTSIKKKYVKQCSMLWTEARHFAKKGKEMMIQPERNEFG